MYPFNIEIGKFVVSNYALFNFLGLLFFFVFMVGLPREYCLAKRWQMATGWIICAFIGTAGAKLVHLLLYAEKYRGMVPERVFLISGHAFIGGGLFSFLAIYAVTRYYKASFLYISDIAVTFLALARGIGRIGCILTGCCHGSVSALPWACYFHDGLLRHPTQAYMAILLFSIFISARMNLRRLWKNSGIIFFSALIMYSAGRFFIEFLRTDSPGILGPLKLSHIILIPLSLYGVIGLYLLYRRYSSRPHLASHIRRLFVYFILSAVIMGIVVLTALSIVPKLNYTDDITLRISRAGIIRTGAMEPLDQKRIGEIRRALERYRQDNGAYPTQEQGLEALTEQPRSRPIPSNWRGPYIARSILSPGKGGPYQYLLYRHGDTFSYKIIPPVAETQQRDYLSEAEIHHALALYKSDNKSYPSQEQGLEALIKRPKAGPIPQNWNGPYLDGPLKNKNDKSYRYKLQRHGERESYFIYTD